MNPVPDLDPTCGAGSESSWNLSILVLLFLLGAVVGYFLARYTFLKVVRRIVSEQEERYRDLTDDANERTYMSGSSVSEDPVPFPMRLTRLPQMMRSMVFQEPQNFREPPEELFDIPAPPPPMERAESSGYVPEEVDEPEPVKKIQPIDPEPEPKPEPVDEIQPVDSEPKPELVEAEPKPEPKPTPVKRTRKSAPKKASTSAPANDAEQTVEI